MTYKIGVDTTLLTDDKVTQTVYSEIDGQREMLMRLVIDAREEQVREALIALGWTPPKGHA